MSKMHKKICIISLENINRTPYINIYKECLKNGFDIIYWNRTGRQENCGAENYFPYYSKVNNTNRVLNLLSKLKGYIGFRKYVKRILKKNLYAGLVCIPSNCCVLVYDCIKKQYSKKYVMEIRDYWKEGNKYYYEKEKQVIEDSYFSVISSKAYRKFLPEEDYVIAHNYPPIKKEELESIRNRKKDSNKIVLSCIGGIKYASYDKSILDKFKNDDRFEIRYIGRGYEVLKDYVDLNNIGNARIEGEFPKEKTTYYYSDTDMILNLYGNNSPNLDYALSNKLYYSALYNMPILVCPNTYMAEIVEKYGLGFVFDKDSEESINLLYDYYKNINWEEYKNNCEKFISEINNEMIVYKDKISEFERNMLKMIK